MLRDKDGRTTAARRPETPEINAKAQIKEYKETLIVDAAARLFYEKGFQGTTIDDIAAALGFTKPFIYTYFKSKHSILERLFDRVYDDVHDNALRLDQQAGAEPVARFRFFVSGFIRKNLEQRQFSAILMEEEKNLSPQKLADMRVKRRKLDKMIADLVQEGRRAGVFHAADPALAALAISGMVRWTHRWYVPEGRLGLDALCAELTQIALRMAGWPGDAAPAPRPQGQRTTRAPASARKK